MKKIIALVLALMLTVTCFAACGKKDGDTKKKYTVGICNYVDDASLNQIVDNIKKQLASVAAEKGVEIEVKYDNCNGDSVVMNQIISNFIVDKVNLMAVGLSTRLPVVGTVGRHPAVYLMGRGAIPSRRGFSRGAMRHPGVSGITRPFGRLSRGRGQVLHVLLSRSPLASLRRGVPFDLHVLGAPPAFILSQDRTLRPKYSGLRARPVLSVHR